MIYVVTYIDVLRDSVTEGLSMMQEYRESGLGHSGSKSVEVLQETSRPNRFVSVEIWNDQASFEGHEAAEQTVQFRKKLTAIYSNPPDQRVHSGFAIDARPAAAAVNPICVVTHVDVPPPRKDEAEILLRRLAEESRRDAGNLRYDVFQQTTRTNHFTVFAVWQDAAAFESHETRPHRRQIREGLWPILGAPYDERLYKPFTSGL